MVAPELDTAPEAPIAPSRGRGAAVRLVDQLKGRSGQLTHIGLAKAAELAAARKDGMVEKLDAASGIVRDLADAAGERFGAPVSRIVNRGGNALDTLSQGIQRQSIEDLVGTARSTIVRYPAVALAAVSVAGFLAGRIVKGGLAHSSDQHSRSAGTNAAEVAA